LLENPVQKLEEHVVLAREVDLLDGGAVVAASGENRRRGPQSDEGFVVRVDHPVEGAEAGEGSGIRPLGQAQDKGTLRSRNSRW